MSAPDSESAEEVFAHWLEARERGEAPEMEALVAAHPEHDEALRAMHSDWQLFAPMLERAVPGSISAEEASPVLPPSSVDDETPAATPELVERLGIHLPEAGRYRFRSVIGRGGGGVVLKVWDAKLRRPLAMKVVLGRGEMRPSGDTPPVDAAVLTRFVDEARIASQLDHPGIVPVHELGTDAVGRAFFTMRLVKGEDLGKVFERARHGDPEWTQARLIEVLVRVCEAVSYAHGKGVLHRDLKPANVMLGRHGEVHVMDWGLARTSRVGVDVHRSGIQTVRAEERDRAPDSPLLTGSGSALGTPAYMAPEQARGELERVDARADVYAIGAMLYELLAGEPPFVPKGAALSPALVLMRVAEGPPRPLSELAASAPVELVAICERAMARELEQRYADVGALERDLRAYLEGRVVSAFESGTWAETRKWMRRNKSLAAALGGLIIALAVGMAVSATLATEASKGRELTAKANEESQRLLRVASRDALRYADGALAASQGGTPEFRHQQTLEGLLYLARAVELDSENGVAWERLALELGALRTPLYPHLRLVHDGPVVDAEFSHDGRRLLTASEDRTAALWNAVNGKCLTQLSHAAPVSVARFSSDDARLLTLADDDSLALWDGATAELVFRWKHPDRVNDVTFSPSGRFVATACEDGMVRVWSALDGTLCMTGRHGNGANSVCFLPDEARLVSAGPNDPVLIWDLSTGASSLTSGWGGNGYALAVNPPWLAVDDGGETTTLVAIDSLEVRAQVNGGGNLVLNPDGSWIVTSDGWSERVSVYSTDTGKEVESRPGSPAAVAFSSDGLQIALGFWDGTAQIWRPKSGVHDLFLAHPARIESVAFDPTGGRVVTACRDGTAGVWDLALSEGLGPRTSHGGGDDVRSCFLPDGSTLITYADGGLVATSLSDFEELDDSWSGNHDFRMRYFTNDGQFLGSSERTQFDPQSRSLVTISKIPGLGRCFGPSAFSADGRRVVTADDAQTTVWNLDTQEALLQPPHSSHPPKNACLTPDGGRLLIIQEDGTGFLRDVDSGRDEVSIEGKVPGERTVFCPAGDRMADGEEREVYMWSTLTGKLMLHLQVDDQVRSLGFSTSGARFFCADGTGRVFVYATENPNAPLFELDQDGCWHVEYSRDGSHILTAGQRQVCLWDGETGERLLVISDEAWGSHATFDAAGRRALVEFWDFMGSSTPTRALLDLGVAQDVRAAAASMLPSDARDLVELVTGSRLDARGHVVPLPVSDIDATVERVRERADANELWSSLARLHLQSGPGAAASLRAGATRRTRTDGALDGRGQAICLELDPGHPLLPIARARGFEEETRRAFLREHGLANLPPDAAVWVRAARMLLDQGDVLRSVKAARGALVLDPASRAAARLAATPMAEALLDEVLASSPTLEDAAAALRERSDLEQAVREAALERLPLRRDQVETWLLSLWYPCPLRSHVEELVRSDHAHSEFWRREALKMLSGYTESPAKLNGIAWGIATGEEATDPKRVELAVSCARRAVELLPEGLDLINTLGVAEYRAGRWQEALSHLSRSDETRRSRGEARTVEDVAFLAMTLWKLGRTEEARAELLALESLLDPEDEDRARYLTEARELIGL